MTREEELRKSFSTGAAEGHDPRLSLIDLEDNFGIGTVLLFRYRKLDDRVAVKTGKDKWFISGYGLSCKWELLLFQLVTEEIDIILMSAKEVIFSDRKIKEEY